MNIFEAHKLEDLKIMIETSTRANEETAAFFVEPAQGLLRRGLSKRHHIIFGRRGSGKSSLLRKVHAENLLSRTPSAFIDVEIFKNNAYPDVLIGVLIACFRSYSDWLETWAVKAPSDQVFWKKLIPAQPEKAPDRRRISKGDAKKLHTELVAIISSLEALLHEPLVAEVSDESVDETKDGERGKAKLKAKSPMLDVSASAEAERSIRNKLTRSKIYSSNKETVLQRGLSKYKSVLERIAQASEADVYLIFDDFYHLKMADQVFVLDYFHQLAKGSRTWLKIGTIRYRTCSPSATVRQIGEIA